MLMSIRFMASPAFLRNKHNEMTIALSTIYYKYFHFGVTSTSNSIWETNSDLSVCYFGAQYLPPGGRWPEGPEEECGHKSLIFASFPGFFLAKHIAIPLPSASLTPYSSGMIAPGNHGYFNIRCALQRPSGEGIGCGASSNCPINRNLRHGKRAALQMQSSP
jgi:hypothetical protein